MSAIRKVPYIIRYNIFFALSFKWVMTIIILNHPDMSSAEVRGQHLPLEHTYADLRCLILNKYIPQLPNIWWLRCYLLRNLTGMYEGEIAPYTAFTILCLFKYIGIDIVLIIV